MFDVFNVFTLGVVAVIGYYFLEYQYLKHTGSSKKNQQHMGSPIYAKKNELPTVFGLPKKYTDNILDTYDDVTFVDIDGVKYYLITAVQEKIVLHEDKIS